MRTAFLTKNHEKLMKLKKKEREDKLNLNYKIEMKEERLQKAKKQHNALLQEIKVKQDLLRKKNSQTGNTQKKLEQS